MVEILGRCPVCDGELKVTELTCSKCGTILKNDFDLCKFCRLKKEQQNFIEVFIKNRGNIKEIEKELKISYPTVRNKLEEVIGALGYKTEDKNATDRKTIINKLANGEITKDEALKMLGK